MNWRAPPLPHDLLARPAPRLWLVAVLFFGVGDLVTTAVGLSVPGVVEVDPVARQLLAQFGLPALLALKAVALAGGYVAWTLVPHPYRKGVPLGLIALGVAVTAWNAFVVAAAVA